MKEFYSRLAEILEVEVDEVKREDVLEDFEEWDSLGILSVISMIDEFYSVLIENEELKELTTAGELEDLIKTKLK